MVANNVFQTVFVANGTRITFTDRDDIPKIAVAVCEVCAHSITVALINSPSNSSVLEKNCIAGQSVSIDGCASLLVFKPAPNATAFHPSLQDLPLT